jgi:hypothetical protein
MPYLAPLHAPACIFQQDLHASFAHEKLHRSKFTFTGVLLGLLFNPEDGGDMFLWIISWLSAKYTSIIFPEGRAILWSFHVQNFEETKSFSVRSIKHCSVRVFNELINCMEHRSSWEADSYSSPTFYETGRFIIMFNRAITQAYPESHQAHILTR